MHKKFRARVIEQLRIQPANQDAFIAIELYYLIRECINRIDPARIADIGENGMQTGVSEYDTEAYAVFEEVQAHYFREEQLTKKALHDFLQELFTKKFYPGIFKESQGQILAQSIYNEIYKIDPGNKRKEMNLQDSGYSEPITNLEEYRRYIDSRGSADHA